MCRGAGDRIPRDTDTLEVIDIRPGEYDDELSTMVVRAVQSGRVPMSD
jgi:hypothetical protein